MAKHSCSGGLFTALGPRLGGLFLFLAVLSSCSSEDSATTPTPTQGPLVRLHLSPVDAGTMNAVLNITAKDVTGQDRPGMTKFPSGPFDLLGVTFPVGTRGATTYQVSLFSSATCLSATGTAMLTLDSDGLFEVAVLMTAVPLCGNGATLTVQVANVLLGSGSVTSLPAGINCAGAATGCSAAFMKGTQITLTAQASMGAFAGWSGSTCTGVGTCTLTLGQDEQVQAVFSACHGWCKEPLPVPITANLNGVSGTAANNVLVVGDNGTALHWDGTAWQQLTPPSGTNVALRAATGKPAGSSIFVAGDGGTVLQLTGATWKSIINASMANLRAVAIGAGGSPATYFVGDGGIALMLPNNGNGVSSKNIGTTVALYGLSQNPNGTQDDLYMGGAVSGGKGFAQSWDGNTAVTNQTGNPGVTITGNINAMLCGVNFHYAAGDGGAIIRRSTSSGNSMKWAAATSSTTQNLRGLWSSSDSNIYAVGDAGTIVQFDGTTWTAAKSNSTTNLRAIWGSGTTNLYAVGEAGTILHYLP